MAPRIYFTAPAAAVFLSLSSSVALADVTPAQVWDDWKSYLGLYGYDVEANMAQSGDTLNVSDLKMTMAMPEDEGMMTITLPDIGFADNGDGTVSVVMPDLMPIKITASDDEGQAFEAVVNYRTQGFTMVASGDTDQMTYDYKADTAALELGEVIVDGTPTEVGKASMTISDLTGATVTTGGDLRETEQTFTSGAVAYVLDIVDPESSATLASQGSIDSFAYTGSGTLPTDMDATDMAAMLDAGFTMQARMETGPGNSAFAFAENGDSFKSVNTSNGGTLGITMDAAKMSYSGERRDVEMTLETNDLPFPVQFASQTLGFDLTTPVAKSDTPQDFAASLTFADVTVSEPVWALFDPGQQLPRDPATVDIDLTGKARLMFDLLDPENAETIENLDTPPAEVHALTLNSLTVRLAGAELTGEGDFTFDNSDLESFGGMPAPLGALDLRLVGGNGLLDKLVSMGLLPQEQASGARMMMGLFARPGDGEDSLVSRIEVNEDGQVMANGQRLK